MNNIQEIKQTTTSQKEIAVSYKVGDTEIKLTPSVVQKFIVGNDAKITMAEFKFFTELCKVRGLNPFLKEAYCIKYGNQPAQIVVGKDVFIKRAALHPDFDGMESGVITLDTSGTIVEHTGTFYLRDNETLVGGWAKVYRKSWNHPTYVTVGFDEVAQRKKDGSLNSNWQTKGATMVEKVAKVRALRETFVDDLGGMYEATEIGVDDESAQMTPQQPQPQPEEPAVQVEPQEKETIEEIDLDSL